MYVFIYIYVCVYVYVRIYVCVYVCIYISMIVLLYYVTLNFILPYIIIRVMVLKYYPYIFNQVDVICGVRGLEASRHLWRSKVRGESSTVAFEG